MSVSVGTATDGLHDWLQCERRTWQGHPRLTKQTLRMWPGAVSIKRNSEQRCLLPSLLLHLLGSLKQRTVPMQKGAAAAASLRASEAACLAAVEAAQDANEARRRVEEELTKEAERMGRIDQSAGGGIYDALSGA
eukprot:Skav207690  [mRNA]  locus=scaffold3057:13986:17349:- [translate_table: standard]